MMKVRAQNMSPFFVIVSTESVNFMENLVCVKIILCLYRACIDMVASWYVKILARLTPRVFEVFLVFEHWVTTCPSHDIG